MSQLPVGQHLVKLPSFQFTLTPGHVFIWRESATEAEGLIWTTGVDLDQGWIGRGQPWKIIGDVNSIQNLHRSFVVPKGSRTICVKGSCRIQCDLMARKLGWQGVRHKRVVIVDDSATLRKLLRHLITGYGDWEVIGELESAESLDSFLYSHFPDLITLDLHMGAIDGAEAMRRFIAPRKIPTILISSQPKEDGGLVMEALSNGAFDYLQKPESGQWGELSSELNSKFESALKSRWQQNSTGPISSWTPISSFFQSKDLLIAIGSSTGGTQALQEILLTLPKEIPPILITQHIPPIFSKALAQRFNDLCPFEVKEAEHGDEVRPNRVLIAPGGHHMRLCANGKQVVIDDEEPINRFRPSVDALFNSIASHSKVPVVGAILTGMGKDGAQGLLKMRQAGAYTIAQDEKSSVVFGMPKEAINIGAAMKIESLSEISKALIEGCSYLIKGKKVS